MLSAKSISAKEVVASGSSEDIYGESIGVVEIYDNSEIVISYRYGLRKVELRYCSQGDKCDMNVYETIEVMESSEEQPYKNSSAGLKEFKYKPILEDNVKYRFKVKAYFGTSSRYSGKENYSTGFMLSIVSIDTDETYVMGSKSKSVGDEGIKDTIDKIQEIVNDIVLPVIYALLALVLVVKGALLGVQIVKSADDSETRSQKVHALKWLIIGVAIATMASTVVGVLTGFFESLV